MKKAIALIVMLICAVTAFAGERGKEDMPFRYEVRLGWSGYPAADDNSFAGDSSYGIYIYDQAISDIFSEYGGPTYMTGNIVGEMNFHFRKWFTLSVGVAANGIWKDIYSSQTDDKLRRETGFTATLMPQARFSWIRKDIVRLYSSVGIGVRAGKFDDRDDARIAAQIVPIGINVGGRIFGFGEIGIGTLYIGGMFGIGYRF